ncbi:uncharacterized protein [Rutidosis leptorrhynchoides]|uniref:uncharacterized protein n=1 Tax=Rutidosis leptorrhynchoides TaxID=125765 RepID=UPI003A99FADF
MSATMIPDLQKDLKHHDAFEMLKQLKEMFQQQARQQRFENVIALHACKMAEGTSVSSYVLKMKSYIDQLERLGSSIGPELAIDLILNSLPKSYDQFILNYNMNNWEKFISELHLMLKTTEKNIPSKTSEFLMIREGKIKKPQAKGRGKGKPKSQGNYKGKNFVSKDSVKKKEKPTKDATCFHCGKIGHWKRNYPTYLAELKKTKASNASTSGIYMIELFAFSSNSWAFDTGCETHICNNVQGLRKIKKLKLGDLVLHVCNGAHVAVVAIGIYELLLPNGLYLILNNCYYVPSLTRNIISAARLYESGYSYAFSNGNISVFNKDVFYFEARPHNGIYEVDIQDSSNNSSLYNINTKRSNGKMTKAPLSGSGERAKDLLGLIHFDAFETFKVFQNEVQNQLGKTIKVLRSDRGVDQSEPTNYKDATLDHESKKWYEAMNDEMQYMYDNEVWDLVDLPLNRKAVGSKWIFKKKTDMDGNVHTFKARLVAKGFTQTHGIDYDRTFSPVAMLKSIRILIAIAAYYDYEIWQMDVKIAFLNGHLSEDVYMEQPEGFVNPKYHNKVCKIKRAIYGLKQASRSWNLRFDEKIKEFDFIKNEDEPCVYKRASGS